MKAAARGQFPSSPVLRFPACSAQALSGLGDVSLLDEEIVDFASLVDVDLDESPGLRQPQPALPSALAQQSLLVLQVGARNQPHHLAQLHTHRVRVEPFHTSCQTLSMQTNNKDAAAAVPLSHAR